MTARRKIFPDMHSAPKIGTIVGTLLVSFMIYVFFPFLLPWWFSQVASELTWISWVELGYLIFCALIIGFLMFTYLKDEFLDLQLGIRGFWKTTFLTLGLMVAYGAAVCLAAALQGDVNWALRRFPLDHQVAMISYHYVLDILPGAGTVVFTVVPPLLLWGMHYAIGFAPVCAKRKWLGYVNIAFNLLLITGFGILWRDRAAMQLTGYLLRLPVHFLACWTYQKTDNGLSPILALMGFNLLACLVHVVIG